MKLHEMKYTEGARKASYRVGRGHGSGNGKTAGKGHKGKTQDQVEAFDLVLKVVRLL